MQNSIRFALTLLGLLVLCGPAHAQISVEFKNALTVGNHTATRAAFELEPAYSFEILVAKRVGPIATLYAGYSQTSFGCAEGFCEGRDVTVSGSHGTVGVEVNKGLSWLRFGLLFGTTTVNETSEGVKSGVGFRGGAGVTFPMSRLRIRPGVSYSWMSANSADRDDHATALSLELGIAWPFG